tara:strand:- start:455 stop:829 length:375 start_codon:yes stop_codon:yes gene_type:complete
MKFKIKHISFLSGGERQFLKRVRTGMFIFQAKKTSGFSKWRSSTSKTRPLKAMEAIRHPSVKSGDPVLTLENGDKIRVFVSGDPRQMVVIAQSILENHDNKILQTKKTLDTGHLEGFFEDFPEW